MMVITQSPNSHSQFTFVKWESIRMFSINCFSYKVDVGPDSLPLFTDGQ